MNNTNLPFVGFSEPKENYFRLPNDWFQIAGQLRREFSERFATPLKTIEYVIRHTWGYRHFTGTVKLTARDIRSGRIVNGRQIDHGTGLSENSVTKACRVLNKLGLIEVVFDETDQARRVRSFRPRIKSNETEQSDDSSPFIGFDLPIENYFKVPASWTDLTRETNSAACILSTEFFFRHGWGYNNPNGVWMDADDVANGRRYVNGKHRYDSGIGFDLSTTYRGLSEAVERGFLVWAERCESYAIRRVFNLRMKGMPVDSSGKYLGRLPWEDDNDPLGLPIDPICTDEDGICIVEVGPGVVEAVPISIDEEVIGIDEEFHCTDEVVCGTDEARTETAHTLTDTSSIHLNQTSTATQRDFQTKTDVVAVGKRQNKILMPVKKNALPDEITQGLEEIHWTDTLTEVTAAYEKNPELVLAWMMFALHSTNVYRSRAGLFRKGLRSGLFPPYQLHPLEASEDACGSDQNSLETTISDVDEQPIDPKARRSWDAIRAQLEQEMHRDAFQKWVWPTCLVGYDPAAALVTIRATSPLARDWLDGRLKSTLVRFMSGSLGQTVDVRFVTPEESNNR